MNQTTSTKKAKTSRTRRATPAAHSVDHVQTTTLADLWNRHAPRSSRGKIASGGRAECPVTLENGKQATHLYNAYGKFHLESIAGKPERNTKGPQGQVLMAARTNLPMAVKVLTDT